MERRWRREGLPVLGPVGIEGDIVFIERVEDTYCHIEEGIEIDDASGTA